MSKLDLEIVMLQLNKLAFNYDIEIKKGYTPFIHEELQKRGFNNNNFVKAISGILENEESLFNKMPAIAMFLKYGDIKVLTKEQKNVQRSSEVMVWLENNCSYDTWMDKPQWVKRFGWDKEKRFEDPIINKMITDNFGGYGTLIDRFLEHKNRSLLGLFRKELVDFMGISEVTVDDTLMIESDKDSVKRLDSCIGALSNSFNKDKIIKENWFKFRQDMLAKGMTEQGSYECAGIMIPTNPIKNAWSKLTEEEKLNYKQN